MHVEISHAVLGSSLSCPQMDLMQALLEESSLGERSNSHHQEVVVRNQHLESVSKVSSATLSQEETPKTFHNRVLLRKD